MIYDIIVYIASIFFFTAIIREVLASLNRVSSIKQKIGETSQAKEAMKKLKLVKTPLSFAFMTSIVIGILLAFEASLNFKKWTTANELLMSGVYINICRMNAAAKAAGMNWEHITPFSILWKSTPEREEVFDWTLTLQIDRQIYGAKAYRGWLLNFYGPFILFTVFCLNKDVYALWARKIFGDNGKNRRGVASSHDWTIVKNYNRLGRISNYIPLIGNSSAAHRTSSVAPSDVDGTWASTMESSAAPSAFESAAPSVFESVQEIHDKVTAQT